MLIGLAFGGLWAVIAALALPVGVHNVALIFDALITGGLICWLWFRPSHAPSGRLFRAKAYWVSVALEVAAIYLASILLSKVGLQAYFIQALGIIVGLHFIGLWRATGSPRFLAISAGMFIVSAIACFLPAQFSGWNPRDFATGLGNALILWAGASGVLWRASLGKESH